MRKEFCQWVVLVFAISINSFAVTDYKSTTRENFIRGEYIVKLKDGVVSASSAGAMTSFMKDALGSDAVVSARALKTDPSVVVVKVDEKTSMPLTFRVFSEDSPIQYAEPNFIYHIMDAEVPLTGVPNDPGFTKLWGLNNSGQEDANGQKGTVGSDIKAVETWKTGNVGSQNILVAVIDTGIQWDHPDLKDNIYVNPGESGDKATNGVDDDGNGFIDDTTGWNFIAKSRNSNDDHNHGTHCAGTIGGKGNNGIGVAGVSWKVRMMPLKFLSASGSGSLENAVEAINYATMMKVNIMSNSWGGGGFSQTMKDAIEKSKEAGILFVAAAGNESNNNDSSPAYPASYDVSNVVSVAATDNQDKIASFSNFGKTKVHVAAPGVKVYSTIKGGEYDTYSGTSMACPHVAGAAALLMSYDAKMTFADVKERLMKTSDPIRGLKRTVASKGRLNLHNAITNTIPPTDEPPADKWLRMEKLVESPHPYELKKTYKYEVEVKGAKYIRVLFKKIDVEQKYDYVSVKSASGELVDRYTGKHDNIVSEYVEGEKVVIELFSDTIVNGYGFIAESVEYIQ